MTQPGETVVDGDRIDEGRRAWPAVLAVLVLGAVIGALVGGLYGASKPADYSAQTALSVLPDPTIDITNTDNSNTNSVASLDATAYIQSQLVIINGRQLATNVRYRLNLSSRPEVVATQVGETYVVQIAASSADRSRALATARAVGSAYDQVRSKQLTTEINGIVTSVRQELSSVQKSLAASRGVARPGAAVTPSQTALQTQYEQLLSERSALRATLAQVPQIVTVVSPASIADPGLSVGARDALAGLVLGAILGVIVLLVFRRTVRRVRSVSDLAALGVPVLLPVQVRRPLRSRSGPAYWQHPSSRLLAARLYADALRAGKPLVVVGATARVGATQVAETVSAALAGRGPVLLVTDRSAQPSDSATQPLIQPESEFAAAPDDLTDASVVDREPVVPSSVPGVWLLNPTGNGDSGTPAAWRLMELVQRASHVGWLVVVDAGAVPSSDLAVQLARVDAAVTLVVGRGTSSPAQVLAATELFEAEGMTNVGAVLNDVPGRLPNHLVRLLGRATPSIETSEQPVGPQLPSDSPLWESLFDEDDDRSSAGHRAPDEVGDRFARPGPTS